MRRWGLRAIGIIGVAFIGIVISNLSLFAPAPKGEINILSHRGVHQTFHREGLTNTTCTAERIYPPTHDFLENTIPSIAAAFEFGADIVEIDIIPTRDGEFAVFHDWTVDCRTNGTGRTTDHSLAELKALDIGYGYTADGGVTYPFRGTGTGMVPSLREVLQTFPDKRFLINVKGNQSSHAERLSAYFSGDEHQQIGRLQLFSGPRFALRWRELGTRLLVGTKPDTKICAKDYFLTGWFGRVSQACKSFGLAVPQNVSWLYWGWPHRTVERLERRDMRVVLIGSLNGYTDGIDTLEQVDKIPHDYRGWVVTNRIEVVGLALNND